jgi:hypothetical protein
MNEEFDNTLTLKNEMGIDVTINVFDIVDSDEFDKTFIIYTLDGDKNVLYASILNEEELTYSLDTIIDEKEVSFVDELIKYFTSDDIEEESV